MKKYKCKFESEGLEVFFDNGIMCETITFYRPNEPALRTERLEYAASMLNALINRNKTETTRNLEVYRWLEKAGVAHYELKDMLLSFLNGECYKDVVRAEGLRVSMYEIHIGLQILRVDDDEHFAFSYLTIPLEDTGGRIVVRDTNVMKDKVIIAWEHGMIQRIS